MKRNRGIYLACLALSCSEYSYTSKVQVDVFQQVRRNTVDVLLTLDNSCSMYEEQEKLSTNFESFISAFAGVDVDWQIGVVTTDTYRTQYPGRLLGGDDELVLEDREGRVIDEVKWDRDWPVEEGVSMQLSSESFTPTSNTVIGNWCLSTEAYGDGDLGSPGGENAVCGASRPMPPDTGDTGGSGGSEEEEEDAGSGAPVEPGVGDLIFTEVMCDPSAVLDSDGEWIELTNLSEETLDLSGYGVRDDGKNRFVFDEGVTVEPGGRLVLGRSLTDNGGVDVDVSVGSDLTLNNNVLYLTSQNPDAQEIFEEMVVVGITGSGIEMGLEGARLALSEPLVSTDNAGFLREEANLSLIFVSDEDDFSPMSAHEYLRFFSDLKGQEAYRDHNMMSVSAVVGMDSPPYDGASSCESVSGVGYYGPRYIELATRTEGVLESICDEDFSPIAQELGLTASGLRLEFELSELADNTTIVVKLYEEESDDSLIGELVLGEDYSYVIENNSIRFEIGSLPASETYIVVEYRVLPEGAQVLENEESGEEGEVE
jgi:hypothetical protein